MERSVNDRNKQSTKTLAPSNGRVKTGTAERGGGGGDNLAAIALKKSLQKFKEKKYRKETHLFCLWFCFTLFKTFILRKTALFCFAGDPLYKFTTIFLRLSILNAFLAILEAQIFTVF